MSQLKQWTIKRANELFSMPFFELLFQAQQIHRQHFDPQQVQVSTLLSIKTGACPEDCKYCAQSARYKTGLETEKLMEVQQVLESAKKPSKQVQRVFVWARHGAIRKNAICLILNDGKRSEVIRDGNLYDFRDD